MKLIPVDLNQMSGFDLARVYVFYAMAYILCLFLGYFIVPLLLCNNILKQYAITCEKKYITAGYFSLLAYFIVLALVSFLFGWVFDSSFNIDGSFNIFAVMTMAMIAMSIFGSPIVYILTIVLFFRPISKYNFKNVVEEQTTNLKQQPTKNTNTDVSIDKDKRELFLRLLAEGSITEEEFKKLTR